MKTIKNVGVTAACAILLMASAVTVNAQRQDTSRQWHGRGMHHDMRKEGTHPMGIPNLSKDQETKIQGLRTSFQKETLPITNLLNEKQAHLRTLQSADKTDLNAINATIDEMTQLQSQLMKKRAANHDAIRKLLTDEQRVAFDSHGGRRGRFHHKGGKRY